MHTEILLDDIISGICFKVSGVEGGLGRGRDKNRISHELIMLKLGDGCKGILYYSPYFYIDLKLSIIESLKKNKSSL